MANKNGIFFLLCFSFPGIRAGQGHISHVTRLYQPYAQKVSNVSDDHAYDGYSARFANATNYLKIEKKLTLDRDPDRENCYTIQYDGNNIGDYTITEVRRTEEYARIINYNVMCEIAAPHYRTISFNFANEFRGEEPILVALLIKISLKHPDNQELVCDNTMHDLRYKFKLPLQREFNKLKGFHGYDSLDSVFYEASSTIHQINGQNIRFYMNGNCGNIAQAARKYWLFKKNQLDESTSQPSRDNILCQNGEIIKVEAHYITKLNNAKKTFSRWNSLFFVAKISALTGICTSAIMGNIAFLGLALPLIGATYKYNVHKKGYYTIYKRNRIPFHPDGPTEAVKSFLEFVGNVSMEQGDGLVLAHASNGRRINKLPPICLSTSQIGLEELPIWCQSKIQGSTPLWVEAFPVPVPYDYSAQ